MTDHPLPHPPNRDRLLLVIDRLPGAAPVCARLADLQAAGGGLPEAVARWVGADPLLADHLRRFLPGETVEQTAEEAVEILGVATVARIAAAQGIQTRLAACRDARSSELDPARFWRRALSAACAARAVARMAAGSNDPDELFHCGLLRHLGMLVLDAAVPRSFARVLRRARESRRALGEAARHVIGIDPDRAGRRFAERWGLPPSIVATIGGGVVAPGDVPPTRAAARFRIVNLADRLAQKLEPYPESRPAGDESCDETATLLGLPADAVERIVSALPTEVEATGAWIAPALEWGGAGSSRTMLAALDEHATARLRLEEENDRSQRRRSFFEAVDWMYRCPRRGASLSESCSIIARAVRRVLDAGVVVFARCDDRKWMHIGRSSGDPDGDVVAAPRGDFESFMRRSLQRGDGPWLLPCGGEWSHWAPALDALSAQGRLLNMPIAVDDRRIFGAIVAVSPRCRDESIVRCPDWRVFCTAAGLLLDAAAWRARVEDWMATAPTDDAPRRDDSRSPAPRDTADAVASLASGAAHDLNTPLAVISGRAQIMAARPEHAAIHSDLEIIRQQVETATGVVNELMELAEATQGRPRSVDPFELLQSCKSAWIEEGLLDAADMEVTVAPATPDIRFDREQLSRLLRDLALNAVAATNGPTRRLSIKAAPDMTEELVVLSVIDNGCGMTPAVRHRAFDPMFSSRRAGRARGLGLTRALRRVQAAGGSIELDSEPGAGTCVTLRLPAAGNEARAADGRQ